MRKDLEDLSGIFLGSVLSITWTELKPFVLILFSASVQIAYNVIVKKLEKRNEAKSKKTKE